MSSKGFSVEPLFEPLLERAVASASLPSFGFIDRAAETLIDNLGIGPAQYERALRRVKQDSRALLRCQWIDEQLQVFFDEHPEGTAIELGAGLSTRFHRLSYSQDWPKFSWLAVDSGEVLDSLSGCFPSLDNYSYCASDVESMHWVDSLSTSCNGPYIVVIESCGSCFDNNSIIRLCRNIHREFGHVHLVVDLSAEEMEVVRDDVSIDISLRSSLSLCSAKKSFFNRILSSKSYSELKQRNVCHLVVGSEPISESN